MNDKKRAKIEAKAAAAVAERRDRDDAIVAAAETGADTEQAAKVAKPKRIGLVAALGLPKLPRSRKAKPPQVCGCGCGEMTKGGRFLPGHDAVLHSLCLRVERGVCELAAIPDGFREAVATALLRPEAGE